MNDPFYPLNYKKADKIMTYIEDKLNDMEIIIRQVEDNVPESDYEQFKRDVGEML